MHLLRASLRKFSLHSIALAAALALLAPRLAHAEAHLLVDAATGKVLEAENATVPWYPASLSKLMTAYVTLTAVKEGRITLDTLFTVSPLAASQAPEKMGFRPGTQITVDNALKMMLVKSANDMAMVLAEGVGGSEDGFSAMMNQTAQKLGMTQTSYVNPNGLPADGQITSARDMAILARAFIHDLPEYEYYVHIPSIRYGRRVTQNFNKLIGRYPGADGFKTGFICASGYNLMASATRNGRRLIAVVLGASSGTMRAVRAAQLLDRGFAANSLSWLKPSLGNVNDLKPVDTTPPNLRDQMCGPHRHKPPSDQDDDSVASTDGNSGTGDAGSTFLAAGLQSPLPKPSELMSLPAAPSEPVVVYTGPTRTGAAILAAAAADAEAQTRSHHRARKTHVAAKKQAKAEADKPEAKGPETKGSAKSEAKREGRPAAKPIRHVAAKPDASVWPAAMSDGADKKAQPKAVKRAAKPKAGAKAGTKRDVKTAPRSTSADTKPAG